MGRAKKGTHWALEIHHWIFYIFFFLLNTDRTFGRCQVSVERNCILVNLVNSQTWQKTDLHLQKNPGKTYSTIGGFIVRGNILQTVTY